MDNNYDEGAQQDFDFMTEELGHEVIVYPRISEQNYETYEDTFSGLGNGVKEVVFLQEVDTMNDALPEGVLSVGDVRCVFKSNSTVKQESVIQDGEKYYKILELTITKGMSNNIIMDIRGIGKKLPNR